MKQYTELEVKQIFKNARHKAIEILQSHYGFEGDNNSYVIIASEVERDIMNMRFQDCVAGGDTDSGVLSPIIIAEQSEATSLPDCPNCGKDGDVRIETCKCIECDSYW